jgi:polyisoprenyl-phosphate glycosyltransferase
MRCRNRDCMEPATDPRKLVTIVCPVFNEERAVPLFYERLSVALAKVDAVRFEILFVNNRSTDGTEAAVLKLKQTDERIQLLTLSRNYGYQASISAGMRHASGDASVNIDVDCEDPPELIPRFIQCWLDGADIAYGIRARREEFILMHWARKLFYRVARRVSDHEIILDMAEFFLIDCKVKEHVLSTRSTFPFVRGQVGYVGFRREGIAYKREKRIIGDTHYNLLGAIRFGVAGLLSSSTLPLRLLAYVGSALFGVDFVAAIAVAVAPVLSAEWVLRSLVMAALLHLGWLAFSAGMLGLYLARVYKDNIGLPLFVADPLHSTIPVQSSQ